MIKETYHYDDLTDTLTIASEQDCEPIIKEIERIKQVTDGRGNTSLGYFVGRIPDEIVKGYMREQGVSFEEFIKDETHVKRILNNPDFKKFRIFEGRA